MSLRRRDAIKKNTYAQGNANEAYVSCPRPHLGHRARRGEQRSDAARQEARVRVHIERHAGGERRPPERADLEHARQVAPVGLGLGRHRRDGPAAAGGAMRR